MKMVSYITKLFISISCLSTFIKAGDILPTIFWDPKTPALHRDHWSKVVNVKIFQSVSFLCPNIAISFIPLETTTIGIHYNLYVRELSSNDTNLDYDTICDPAKSRHVYSCNQTHNWKIDYKRLTVSKVQADRNDPTFNVGKDYIFFSTSNGQQNSLRSNLTKCTMVFRIHVCDSRQTDCLVPLCPTFGREEGCVRRSSRETPRNEPRDVHVTKATSSSLSISWKKPQDNAVASYSICYRQNTSQECQTKVIDGNVTSGILKDLQASTLFFIRVRTITCKGPGNYSEEISHETRDDPVTSAPRHVMLSGVTSSSVRISWKSPDVIVGDVIFYSVCVREKNGNQQRQCRRTLVEPTQQSAVIYGLNPNTSYSILVRAENFKKPGNYSEEVIARTLETSTTEVTTSILTNSPTSSTRKTTEAVSPPSAQGQHGCDAPAINSMSLIIGLVVGAIATLGILALVWLWKVKRKQDMKPTVKNVKTNKGYRWSVSGLHTVERKTKGNPESMVELDSVARNNQV